MWGWEDGCVDVKSCWLLVTAFEVRLSASPSTRPHLLVVLFFGRLPFPVLCCPRISRLPPNVVRMRSLASSPYPCMSILSCELRDTNKSRYVYRFVFCSSTLYSHLARKPGFILCWLWTHPLFAANIVGSKREWKHHRRVARSGVMWSLYWLGFWD